MQEKETPTQVKDDNELKNFPDEMGTPVDENWRDYSKFERNPKDSDTMFRIWQIFCSRLFPILSLTYIASVLGICLRNGTHFLTDSSAHYMSFMIMIWVSVAPVTWICMRAMIGEFQGRAQVWYLWIAGLQAACGLIFFFMFPEDMGPWLWGFQSFFVSSVPIHIVIYVLFMKRALPASAAWPLTIIGGIFMIYGLLFA